MVFTIRTATVPDRANRNGVIYSKEAIEKAYKEAKEKGPIYIQLGNSNSTTGFNDESLEEFCTVKPDNILGEVLENDFNGLLKVDIDDNKVDLFKNLLSSDYKAGMRYLGDIDKDGNVSDIKFISYETINNY